MKQENEMENFQPAVPYYSLLKSICSINPESGFLDDGYEEEYFEGELIEQRAEAMKRVLELIPNLYEEGPEPEKEYVEQVNVYLNINNTGEEESDYICVLEYPSNNDLNPDNQIMLEAEYLKAYQDRREAA